MLALQLGSSDRYNAALIDQIEQHKASCGLYPKVVIFDLTRNEDNVNVESVYSTLENIKNGRLDTCVKKSEVNIP